MQLEKGRPDARRSEYAAALERFLTTYLDEIYVGKPVVIKSEKELARWGVDPEIFNLFYKEWKTVVVDESGVLVSCGG